jgi:hypothetical protein
MAMINALVESPNLSDFRTPQPPPTLDNRGRDAEAVVPPKKRAKTGFSLGRYRLAPLTYPSRPRRPF